MNVQKICRAKESETGIEYFVLHRVLNAYNNIHHYSSFTAAKVIFFGFSLYVCVCLPASSHSFSLSLYSSLLLAPKTAPIPFWLLLLNSRPTFVYRCVILLAPLPLPFSAISLSLFHSLTVDVFHGYMDLSLCI